MENNQPQFTRFISPTEKDQLYELVSDRIEDLVWNQFFYIAQADPVGSALTAGQAYSDSETNEQITLSINKESRFRCVFNLLAYNSGDAYITTNHVRPVDVGYNIPKNTGQWTGFKISSTGIYAVNYNKGKSSEIKVVKSPKTGDDYLLEIRFFPRERADYFVNGKKVASISENLPSDDSLEIFAFHFTEVRTSGSTLDIQRIEFLQSNR